MFLSIIDNAENAVYKSDLKPLMIQILQQSYSEIDKMKFCLILFSIFVLHGVHAQVESGECSWYGAEGEIPPGHPTACGEGFDRFAMKAAHKTLPCGTKIRVRNKDNGRTVDVTINDRGPFTPGRIVDLTYGAFGVVENHDRGLFPCDYEII